MASDPRAEPPVPVARCRPVPLVVPLSGSLSRTHSNYGDFVTRSSPWRVASVEETPTHMFRADIRWHHSSAGMQAPAHCEKTSADEPTAAI